MALAIGALAGSCGGDAGRPAATVQALFPLDGGRQWTYRVTTELDGQSPQVETLTIANRGPETLAGETAWRRRSDAGLDYWLRADATGIYRVAHRVPPWRDVRADAPHRYVLRTPLDVGTQWQVDTTAYVLQRRNEVPKEVRRTHKPFAMTYTIAALDEAVRTPAGAFEHCLRLDGLALVRLWVEERRDFHEVPLTAREWYCPGVGLARLERIEATPSRFMVGGRVTMELLRQR